MMAISFGAGRPVQQVLCIGAHCDDIEIGCGGTLLEVARQHPGARFRWVVFSGEESRPAETRRAASRLMANVGCDVDILDFTGSYFFAEAAKVKDAFESLKRHPVPDVIFTHCLDDRHQDHRLLAELTWNTFRNHVILEYEIPKYEGDLGQPNLFVPLKPESVESKVETLMECFPSQRGRAWFTADTFRSLMRLRGIECNSESGFAEAFHARKLTL